MTPRDQLLFGAAGAAILAVALSAWMLLAPATDGDDPAATEDSLAFVPSGAPLPTAEESETLLIDVEGGVARPGVVELPGDARIGEAIAAAGGYSEDADVLAAAATLNLAALLADGQQVYVPVVGVPGPGTGAGAGGTTGSSGSGPMVNLNTATPEELDGLPGIGPVTVQKIVAARQERPFATLEELVERKVLNNGQLDKVRELVTV